MPFELEHEMFSTVQIEEVAVIRFKGNLLFQLSDLYLKEALFDHLQKVSHSRDIKVILFFGSPDKIRRQETIQFFRDLSQPGVDVKRVTRIYNAVNQLILMIQKMQKLVIHADTGEVGSLFMNVSLACDYWITGDKNHFPVSHDRTGPGSKRRGGVFFFPAFLVKAKPLSCCCPEMMWMRPRPLSSGWSTRWSPRPYWKLQPLKPPENSPKSPCA